MAISYTVCQFLKMKCVLGTKLEQVLCIKKSLRHVLHSVLVSMFPCIEISIVKNEMHVRVCNQSNKSSEIEIWFNIKLVLMCWSDKIQSISKQIVLFRYFSGHWNFSSSKRFKISLSTIILLNWLQIACKAIKTLLKPLST